MSLQNSTGLAVVLVFSLSTLSIAANRVGTGRVSEDVKAQALVNYGKLPLSFEENRGQSDARVKFLSHGSDYSILLAPAEVFLNLQAADKAKHQSTIRIGFPGANSAPGVAGSERQSAISSYFIGNDPAKWVTGAPNFARVHYTELYPGIDLAFYGNQGRLEYDFVVAPGADPRAIGLAFDGIDGMRIDGGGDLVVSTAAGEVRQHKPIVYQDGGGRRQTINGRYVLQSNNRVAFEVGRYDASKPLIIDPVLSFATYLGSPGDELDYALSAAASQATYPAVAVDPQGNVYVTGYNGGSAATFTGHPTTLGGGKVDVFVVKMSPTGSLVYAVVFGGGLTDIGGGIAVDSSGNAYVTGYTTSSNFPITAGAPQTSFYGNGSDPNAFVTEVNTAGTALVYSTYLGGSGSFWGRAIAVDHSGNAYVTGTASASAGTSFPLVKALSSIASAGFLTEINAGGTTGFAYSTYLPAGIGYGIAVDSIGDAYVTGSSGTASTPSPAQGYVLKVNAGGTSVGYGPVLLGTGATVQTVGFGIALDSQNDAYVTGMTNDPSFPQITSGAAQTKYGGGSYDGFALKLNSSGSLPPVYGTYIGGLGSSFIPERGSGIGVDAEGNAYVSGTTQCIGFPVASPISGARNGGPAALMEGTLSGSSSNWSPTTLTGPFDQVTALAFDPTGATLYAGTGAVNATGGGVYKLASGSWTSATSGITSTTIDAVAVDPNASSTVYAAGSGHLYQTTNSGTSWTQLAQAVGTSAAIAIAKTGPPSTVYAGSSTGLIYSTSPGTSWSTPTTAPGSGAVYTLVVDPNNATTAYAGTPSGVYQTTDGGKIWSAVNTGLPTISSVTVAVTSLAINGSTRTIYAATGNGLFYTTNAGSSWTQANLGYPEQIVSTPLLVAVDAGNNVYVAFEGSGMATATGGGTSQSDWSELTYSGLTNNQIYALAVPPNSSDIAYAGIVSATTAFLTQISPSGQSFLSSTCIGGSDNNLGQNIAVTPGGAVLMSGATIATNFPTTPGAVQTFNAGLYDAFVVGIDVPAAEISSPMPGITLSGSLADFSWGAVGGATEYQLTVGTTPGGSNIFSGTTAGT
ncbi:MAG TPA: SBBP repeat-containing protein, partial [Bryobacteraceae bacterium]|nr:SBBP repeat-containing protein [Bryobacteraceae bacterium]